MHGVGVTTFGGDSLDVFFEIRRRLEGFVGVLIVCVGPGERCRLDWCALVLCLDEGAEGVMAVDNALLRGLREVRSLWVIGGEVGGIKGALEVEVDATGPCIVVFEVNEV